MPALRRRMRRFWRRHFWRQRRTSCHSSGRRTSPSSFKRSELWVSSEIAPFLVRWARTVRRGCWTARSRRCRRRHSRPWALRAAALQIAPPAASTSCLPRCAITSRAAPRRWMRTIMRTWFWQLWQLHRARLPTRQCAPTWPPCWPSQALASPRRSQTSPTTVCVFSARRSRMRGWAHRSPSSCSRCGWRSSGQDGRAAYRHLRSPRFRAKARRCRGSTRRQHHSGRRRHHLAQLGEALLSRPLGKTRPPAISSGVACPSARTLVKQLRRRRRSQWPSACSSGRRRQPSGPWPSTWRTWKQEVFVFRMLRPPRWCWTS
mmetsp:Transcript_1213/g.3267  ORF Transcript_1213/g.3267 Transcript_1213/m.3267 type:complete len:318 (-) Transcript_1213:678-1631(-)